MADRCQRTRSFENSPLWAVGNVYVMMNWSSMMLKASGSVGMVGLKDVKCVAEAEMMIT